MSDMAPVIFSEKNEYDDLTNETLATLTNYTVQLFSNTSDFDNVNATTNATLTTQSTSYALALKFLDFLNLYYLAVIIVFGILGNALSFLVFTRTHLKLRSSSYYLAALALADLGFLVTLLVVWLNHFGVDLFNRPGFCQALVYLSSVSSCMSVWLTVAFTFERLIAVQYPLKRSYMCTVRRAKIIIGCITITTLICHIYSLFNAGVIETTLSSTVGANSTGNARPRTAVCDLLPHYYQAMRIVNILDTVVTLVIPLILIVVMNSLIAKSLVKFNRTFKSGTNKHRSSPHHSNRENNIQMNTLQLKVTLIQRRNQRGCIAMTGAITNPANSVDEFNRPIGTRENTFAEQQSHHQRSNSSTTLSNNDLMNEQQPVDTVVTIQQLQPCETQVITTDEAVDQLQHHEQRHGNVDDSRDGYRTELNGSPRNILSIRTQYTITKMLLLISTVYIMLNLPSYVMRLRVFIKEVITTDMEFSSMAWLLQQFFMMLYYTNFSINFLLYSMCGSTFRHCLFRMIREKIPNALIPERLR